MPSVKNTAPEVSRKLRAGKEFFIMNKKLIASKNLNNAGIRLDYYVIRERYIDITNNTSTGIYGVEVQEISSDEQKVQKNKSRTICDVTCNESRMIEFVKLLCENEVTPHNLYDIVLEKADSGYFDAVSEKADKSA